MKRGDISQCSFGFIPTKQQWDETGKVPVRTIQACQLFDVSPVTYPAYASTECQARSAEDVLLEHRAANLEQPTVPDYRIDLAAKLAVISALTATDF
jgi:hypothetical protein